MKPGLPADAKGLYSDGFAQSLAGDANAPAWLRHSRRTAFDAFVEQGWPNTKQEDWRFTDVSPITRLNLLPPRTRSDVSLSVFDPNLLDLGTGLGPRLVFVDGGYQAGRCTCLPLPDGLLVKPISSVLDHDSNQVGNLLGHHLRNKDAFVALNTAFMTDGAFIHIPAHCNIEQPIFLIFLASVEGGTSHPRSLVWAGEGSRATIVEIHMGYPGKTTLSNAATEIVLEPGAHLAYHSIQNASAAGFHIGHLAVTQKAGSEFSAHSLFLDGRIVRNDVTCLLADEGCKCNLDGLYLASGENHVANHTTIDHRGPRSTSRESYRGVVGGHSHAVFSGRIVVEPGAQQTDARQTNRNLLLDEGAQVHTKPHLEIFANDVKCSHGATTGRLDQEALFYLRSRGLGEKEANRMLIGAFLHEGLERIEHASLRKALESVLVNRIDQLTNPVREVA
jgi:Fe-S cluster assembly protein SufD